MEQKIYVGQTALALDLQTGLDLAAEGAVSAKMKYTKPSGVKGEWTCTIEPDNLTGIIRYEVPDSTTLDESGMWSRCAFVTFSNGKYAQGDPITFYVYESC